jgi:BioD-like phosphotransacetylase family protein
MPSFLIAAPQTLSGKTTVAVGIAKRFTDAGRSVALLRLAGDQNAAADAELFAGLAFNARRQAQPVEPGAATADADVTVIEAAAGDPRQLAGTVSAKVVIVVAYAEPLPADIASYCRALENSCAGVIITRVPRRRLEATRAAAESSGASILALIPEDRSLAAPTLGAVAEALDAEAGLLDGAGEALIDRPLISSISADPAQGYIASYGATAVIVRADKPDQQLAALNAGAPCLIVTGGLAVLSYVEDRAEEEEIPILRTRRDTLAAVERLESLYATTPFSGRAKVERVAQLMGDLDLSQLA